MRLRQRRTDRNQPEIVKALRKAGAFVQSLHKVGDGCPDLVVFRGDRCVFMEIKDGTRPEWARRLTPMERDWQAAVGPKHVVTVCSVEEALEALGVAVTAAETQ